MSGVKLLGNQKEAAKALNRLAREETKQRLLQDILADMKVCEIEGWDKTEYIKELQELINSFKGGNR